MDRIEMNCGKCGTKILLTGYGRVRKLVCDCGKAYVDSGKGPFDTDTIYMVDGLPQTNGRGNYDV